MAYPMLEEAIIEVAYLGDLDGQRTLSLFHYRLSGTATDDGALWLSDLLSELGETNRLRFKYLSCCAEPFQMIGNSAQLIWAPTPNVRRRPRVLETLALSGLVEEAMNTSGVAVAVTKRTDEAGRKGFGTLHMPAVPIPFIANSVLTTTALTAYEDLGIEMLTGVTIRSLTATPIIYRRSAPGDSPVMTGSTVESTARTMRRRVVGRGI